MDDVILTFEAHFKRNIVFVFEVWYYFVFILNAIDFQFTITINSILFKMPRALSVIIRRLLYPHRVIVNFRWIFQDASIECCA